MRNALGLILVLVIVLSALVWVPEKAQSAPSSTSSSSTFSSAQALDFLSGKDEYPSALQASNGTLWVVWQRPGYTLYYKTFNGSFWSTSRSLATGTRYSIAPGIGQLQNGTIILLWSSNQTGYWNLYYKTLNGNTWGSAVQLTAGSYQDFFPTPVVVPGWTIWVFWERISLSGSEQIYYKRLTGDQWSSDLPLTSGSSQDVTPTALATKDGRVFVSWSRLVPNDNYNLFYRTFNGTQWSSEASLTTSSTWDIEPSLVQDRNNTIWLFWSRQMQLSSGQNAVYQQKLWYKYSQNGGKTWSPDTQLTFTGNVSNPIDDLEPSAVQGRDRSLWIFFSSDLTGLGSDFDIYYLKSSPILIHDVALSGFKVPPFQYPGGMKSVGQSSTMKINITISDPGDFSETVQVSLTVYNSTTYNLGVLAGTVAPGSTTTITFNWNTTGVKPARYSLSASVAPVAGELNLGDNTLSAKYGILILPLGDVNRDGSVTLLDVSVVFYNYGFTAATPSRWNPYADINGNGMIDIVDVGIVSKNYGATV